MYLINQGRMVTLMKYLSIPIAFPHLAGFQHILRTILKVIFLTFLYFCLCVSLLRNCVFVLYLPFPRSSTNFYFFYSALLNPGLVNQFNGYGSHLDNYNKEYSQRYSGTNLDSFNQPKSRRHDSSFPVDYPPY